MDRKCLLLALRGLGIILAGFGSSLAFGREQSRSSAEVLRLTATRNVFPVLRAFWGFSSVAHLSVVTIRQWMLRKEMRG